MPWVGLGRWETPRGFYAGSDGLSLLVWVRIAMDSPRWEVLFTSLRGYLAWWSQMTATVRFIDGSHCSLSPSTSNSKAVWMILMFLAMDEIHDAFVFTYKHIWLCVKPSLIPDNHRDFHKWHPIPIYHHISHIASAYHFSWWQTRRTAPNRCWIPLICQHKVPNMLRKDLGTTGLGQLSTDGTLVL